MAWISEAYDEEAKKEITTNQIGDDIDSAPGANPDVTKDTMENYKGKKDNPEDLTKPDTYYEGEQDDDDFEKLVLKKAKGEYQLKLKKVSSEQSKEPLQGAHFKVTLPGGTTQEGDTNQEGIFTIEKIPITETNVDEITIEEINPPSGYQKLLNSVKLDVTKKLEEGVYKASKIELKDPQASGVGEAKIEANLKDGIITITIPNKKIEKKFDLALRKYITKIGKQDITTRVPVPELSDNDIAYKHDKTPLKVAYGDIVIYTIRVYNEGEVAGYAQKITDDIPKGLEFLPTNPTNEKMRWKMIDDKGNVTESVEEAVKVTTDYLSKEQGEEENLLEAFDKEAKISETNPAHKEVQIAFKVIEPNSSDKTITNSAQISEIVDKNGDSVKDVDSIPDKWNDGEDDQDQENIKLKEFDLALRKFVTKIGEQEIKTRYPEPVDSDGKITYQQNKAPLDISEGNIVTYTIRVYNEGEIAGYAKEVTDDIPKGLEFLPTDQTNRDMGWKMLNDKGEETENVEEAKKVTTDYLSKEQGESRKQDGENPNLLKAFDKEKAIDDTNPDYKDVQIVFKVVETDESNKMIINSAQISKDTDENGEEVEDVDSTPDKWIDDEDDQDQEFLKMKSFDLALKKFITKVGEKEVATREPQPKYNDVEMTYEQDKTSLKVSHGDIITYTIRVYNEGEIAGYAQKITDEIPEGLEFLPEDPTNVEMGWKMLDSEGEETENVEEAVKVTTDYLSKAQGEKRISENPEEENPNLLKAFDKEMGVNDTNPDYKDVQILFRVTEANTSKVKITNSAQISEDADENGDPVEDVDSTPDEWKEGEDDQDQESIVLQEFDLALRKFITEIGEESITTRIPKPVYENEKITYEHDKTPLEVEQGSIVTYTIRVYNEGETAGYAQEITDDIPEGLEYLPQDETNVNMRWKMIDSEGKETDDVTKAVKVTTDYLSKEQGENNLLHAFNKEEGITDTNPNYKDVKIVFKVISTNASDRIIINSAQISEDADKNGDPVEDIDSTPDEWKEGEDDQDQEVLKLKPFDLALKKFITQIGEQKIEAREPEAVYEDGKITYEHNKEPLQVSEGNIVTYTIRVYNEGETAGYAQEITDDIPNGLEFLPNNLTNTQMRWKMIDSEGKETEDVTKAVKVTTDYLSKEQGESEGLAQVIDPETGLNINPNLLYAFNKDEEISETNPEYKDVQIAFKVVKPNTSSTSIINSAQISKDADKNGDPVDDIDSTPDEWKEEDDDQDQEFLELKSFDLALKKFITKIGEKEITTREPQPSYEDGEITYKHNKATLNISDGNIVTYTIRVYNEGEIAGYAQEVTDDIPEGLEYLPQDETNTKMRWKMIDSEGKETEDIKKAVKVTTDYLSKEQGESRISEDSENSESQENENPNLLKAFDKTKEVDETNPDYRDVQIVFKVNEKNVSNNKRIVNSAQISEDADENGDPVEDIDSTPDEWKDGEDDQDQESIELKYFDLSLKKFITKIGEQDITTRLPVPKLQNEDIVYEHTKDVVDVAVGDIITYTIRVYNEGTLAGYAQEVTDNIPEGLEYLPQNETNIEMRWKMIDSEGKETKDVTKAKKIITDYLSKEQGESRISENTENTESPKNENPNLLKAFNKEEEIKEGNPDYRDVVVAFKVKETETSDKTIVNSAQISEDADENGDPVEDKDSTPDEWKDGEDDQDQETVRKTYFDLSLKKWVTQAIVIENGKQTVTQTGNSSDMSTEPLVKIEIHRNKLNNVTVEFRYTIRVTNEGDIEGYAKEITDYVPSGLKFVAQDNPGWTDKGNNVVSTRALENTLLKPGQSADVEILLTWVNGEDNMGQKTNTAEITEDYNDRNVPDRDSTPGNKKQGEDDMDDAPILLSVQTGQEKIYYALIFTILLTTVGGITLIKKFVL